LLHFNHPLETGGMLLPLEHPPAQIDPAIPALLDMFVLCNQWDFPPNI
jgi:hypothetical protein